MKCLLIAEKRFRLQGNYTPSAECAQQWSAGTETSSSHISATTPQHDIFVPSYAPQIPQVIRIVKITHTQMDQVRPWCSLPDEILSLIVSYLPVGDICVFRDVCKCWSETPLPFSSTDTKQPFLYLPRKKFCHQMYKYSYRIKVYECLQGHIRASHSGWLLITLYECCLLFFNPFTGEKVEIPNMSITHYWPNLAFSSPPTSPDCLVFGVLMEPTCDEKINIYIIKPGQKNWTIHEINCKPYFKLSSCNPIFFKGRYYCLGDGGNLLIYDPKRNKHRWVGSPNPRIHNDRSTLGYEYYMVESKGKLLMVCSDHEGHSINVFRLDTSKRRLWEKNNNLSEINLFVSQATSFAMPSVLGGIGNKIYFPKFDGDKQLYYSLSTRKYHYSNGSRFWKKFNEIKLYPNSTWIKQCHSS